MFHDHDIVFVADGRTVCCFRGDADARASEEKPFCFVLDDDLLSSFLPVLLFSYSDDEDRLHDRVLSPSDVLIPSSSPLRPVGALFLAVESLGHDKLNRLLELCSYFTF